ncbi:hypothetical protein MSAN_01938000 [Mycena sanguinolenta]|uniref:Uncharacterized protein n=1 Tax=Mycena sanguinolenta TaxID=230812 RepID=A0A8H7CQI9_9AGAR|nr:hypothetical protein MSAN_01938000 [Mycena sanguinolenta]
MEIADQNTSSTRAEPFKMLQLRFGDEWSLSREGSTLVRMRSFLLYSTLPCTHLFSSLVNLVLSSTLWAACTVAVINLSSHVNPSTVFLGASSIVRSLF